MTESILLEVCVYNMAYSRPVEFILSCKVTGYK